MTDLLSIQTALCLIFILVVSNEQLTGISECYYHYQFLTCLALFAAFANDSCQVYPSEYAYKRNSVYGSERSGANCRPYASGLEANIYTENYNHCDGTQLRLTDSDLGSEQYSSSDYYVWNAISSGSQLLFIFPTRVNLTTITLHYYSDNTTTLPRLKFFVVPYDFDVWNAPLGSYSQVDIAEVPPGGEPAGRRNVSVNINFVSMKVLFYRYRSEFAFAVSELKFFNCTGKQAKYSLRIILNYNIVVMQDIVTEQVDNATTVATVIKTANSGKIDSCMYFKYAHTAHNLTLNKICIQFVATDSTTVYTTDTDTANSSYTEDDVKKMEIDQSGEHTHRSVTTTIGIATAIAIVILLLTAITAIVSFLYLRKSAQKSKVDYVDSSYSTLCRESGQQMQSQSLHTSNDLYDQIQLSPSTGQAEFISRNETANTNNSPPHQTEYGIHPSVDKDKPKSDKLKITVSTISTQDEDKSTSEQPTYAVVNKKKKQMTGKESVNCQSKDIAEVSQNEGESEQNVVEQGNYLQESQDSPDTTRQYPSQTIDSPQELYTAVKKKPKDRPVEDKKVPTILRYTTEELYTAAKKKPHASTAGDDEETPQIPPHTIEELYTAVQKKPKANATVDEEEAPPIPPHTVEELYTAVVKKPKVSTAEDEEEAPPVPPYTVDEL